MYIYIYTYIYIYIYIYTHIDLDQTPYLEDPNQGSRNPEHLGLSMNPADRLAPSLGLIMLIPATSRLVARKSWGLGFSEFRV